MESNVAAVGGQFDQDVRSWADFLEFEDPPIKFGKFFGALRFDPDPSDRGVLRRVNSHISGRSECGDRRRTPAE
jgi:hypothetical protein